MAVIEVNLNPSPQELKWFGLIVFVFFGLIGGIVLWYTGSFAVPTILWVVGVTLCIIYYSVRPLRRPMYVGWMYVVFPIGWTISHLLFAFIYYLVVTPIGLIMRLCGRDPMQRRFIPKARSYWVEHRPEIKPSRYFQQF